MSQELSQKYFSNSKEELEFYKNTYKLKVDELISCQTRIKLLENMNNKLKEQIVNGFSKNIENNESSKFIFTPKEFKNLWESVIQTDLIDSFDFCIKEYKLISNLSQDIMLLVYEEVKNIIEGKFCEILKCLNISKISKNKKDNLYVKILPFFRENFHNVFEFNEEKINNIKQKMDNVLKQYSFLGEINLFKNNSSKALNNNDINNNSYTDGDINNNVKNIENIKILENKIKGKNFDGIIKNFFTICLYMLLHEPPLNFNIENYSKRKLTYYFYNKKDYINVEGFGYDKSPCILILQPPLLKNKYPFNGLKPAVYILSDSLINKEIINQCEINEKNKDGENKKENNENYNNKIIYNTNNNNNNDNDKKMKIKTGKNNVNKFNGNNDEIFNNKNNNNLNFNNYIINNNEKILKNSTKNNIGNKALGNYEDINNNYIISNKINIKDNQKKRVKNNNYINNINNKGHILENNNEVIKQKSSYNQIQNNNCINKANYLGNSNFINDNYYIKNIFQLYNENNNTDRTIKKEKSLLEKYKYEKEFDLIDINPIFNYSQKVPNDKNNNTLYSSNNIENLLNQNINNKKNINKEIKQNKISNNINHDNNLKQSNNTNNNSKNKKKNNQNTGKIEEDKFKRNNTVGIPTSEKINAKYYSSFNNIINDKSNIMKLYTNINEYNVKNYMTLKKVNKNKIKEEYQENDHFNLNTNQNNYYSHDENYFYDSNNIDDNIILTDRKIKTNQNPNKYNNNNKNNLYIKKRGIETSIQKNKYYNQYNLKDSNLIKKNNLSSLFDSINNKKNNGEKIKNINFGENKQVGQNQKNNYINNYNNNINNINNYNYYNNIYNNNYYNLNPNYIKENSINNDKKSINNINNEYKINNFNRSLNNNKPNINYAVENQYNNYIITNKNEKENKNQILSNKNQIGQSSPPFHFKSQNLINNSKNKLYKSYISNCQNSNNMNNINKKQSKEKYLYNIKNNPNFKSNANENMNKNHKNNENNNNFKYKISNEYNNNRQQNDERINKNVKRRNKSLNDNHLHYNNINKFYNNNNNNIDDINNNEQTELSNEYKKKHKLNIKNIMNINDSFNMNNYYLNELEVLKIKDKYKFNKSYLKEYGYN